ncbi:L-alanine-DL-glutamate epimerase-like enolase superfamily enzyme [Flexivirga oryzae]|uniref:L-alanine-DL-glutamate epimerase-like enolase superfamily enzyme n=2 Tax=Flexivirga oryzae TaxID=1794944 RepID=A0A839N8E4_9MICO|nr:L-alanine-DL-glutamate epimerase-like enolase superfamily enzyme [Flexivirga oryzae]
MKITKATVEYYEWSRPRPISNGLHTYDNVTHGVVRVYTDADVVGIGISAGRMGERQFLEMFCERVVGLDPLMSEHVWSTLRVPKLYGRRGLETRAMSAIDLALWDIKAKVAGMPLYSLLGGFRTRIPAYVAGGYYAEGKSVDDLAEEMSSYVATGACAVKMKVGAVPLKEDVERVKAVRAAIGPDVRLLVDANCAYTYYDAIQFARRIEEYDIFWFEEPVDSDDYEGMRKIANASPITLAAGENEYGKFGFRDLIATQAIGVLQPDVRYTGGVTEFMKIAAIAQSHGLDVCPHGDQQTHLNLLAAIPNALMVEYYPREFDPMWGKIYRDTPEINSDGTVTAPSVPGNGCEPNDRELKKFRIG